VFSQLHSAVKDNVGFGYTSNLEIILESLKISLSATYLINFSVGEGKLPVNPYTLSCVLVEDKCFNF
jgi:hypothetical protein